MEGVFVSVAKADSSSPKLVREATSSSVSLVEIPATLLEDDLSLPLDFLFATVVHCWLSIITWCTYIISPQGVGTKTRPFFFLLWGLLLITLSFSFKMGTTLVGTKGSSLPN